MAKGYSNRYLVVMKYVYREDLIDKFHFNIDSYIIEKRRDTLIDIL